MLSLEEEPEVELSNNGAVATIISAAVCVLLLVVLGLLGLYYRTGQECRGTLSRTSSRWSTDAGTKNTQMWTKFV